ncbi:MAG: hypothetical protein ACM3ML_16410 [Micromonosporaceae bacterium]
MSSGIGMRRLRSGMPASGRAMAWFGTEHAPACGPAAQEGGEADER